MKPYYEDESVTLYHGDCREVLENLPAGVADMVCTDPPYAAAAATVTTGRGKQTWGGNWGDMSLVAFMAQTFLDSPTLAPEHEAFVFADHLSYGALMPVLFRRYPVVQNIVWDKDKLGMGAYFRKQTEQILYARTRHASEFVSKSSRDLIRLRPSYSDRVHPAQKPIELMAELIEPTAAKVVLDPFAGSGSTLLAAKSLGRRSIGVEIEERYCEAIAARLTGWPYRKDAEAQGDLFGGVA